MALNRISKKRQRTPALVEPSQKKQKKRVSDGQQSLNPGLELSTHLPEENENQFMDDLRMYERELGIVDEASLRAFEEEMKREEGEDVFNLLTLTDSIMKGVKVEDQSDDDVFSDEMLHESEEPNNSEVDSDNSESANTDEYSASPSASEEVAPCVASKKMKASRDAGMTLSKTFEAIETWLADLKRFEGAEGFKTKIKSNLNKLSEGNMDILLKEFVAMPKAIIDTIKTPMNIAVSRGRLSPELNDSVTTVDTFVTTLFVSRKVAVFGMTTPSLISTMTAFCGGCRHMDPDYSICVAKFVQMCQESVKNGMDILLKGSTNSKFEDVRFECRSAVQAVSLAFDFGMVDDSTMFEFLKFICGPVTPEKIDESRADLLLILLKFCDNGIKKLDKNTFSDIFDFIGKRLPDEIAAVTNRKNFLLEEILKMKEGTHRPINGSERFDFVRNWLHRQGTAMTGLPLRWLCGLNMDNLLQRAGGACSDTEQGSIKSSKSDDKLQKLAKSDKQQKLLLAAQTLKLHSQVQQASFIALMGAEDEDDAIERILTAVDAKKDIPVVVAVIILVATKTQKFNIYYLNIIKSLCHGPGRSSVKNSYKHAVKKCIAAQLGAIGTATKMERSLLGSLVAHLVVNEIISAAQLRFIDIKKAGDTLKAFALTLSELLADADTRADSVLCCRGQEQKSLRDIEDITLLLSNAIDSVISKLQKDKSKKSVLAKAVELKNAFIL